MGGRNAVQRIIITRRNLTGFFAFRRSVWSSVRKMEKYIANEIWKPALIILVQWNEFFGMKFQQCDKRDLASDLCESICRPCAVAGKQGVEYDCLPEDVIELKWKRCDAF